MPPSTKAPPAQYILMPPRGMQATARSFEADLLMSFSMGRELNFGFRRQSAVRVLDQIRENGPRLLEIATRDLASFRAQYPHMRLVPIRHFRPMVESLGLARPLRGTRSTSPLRFEVEVRTSLGQPLADCKVLAFTNFASRAGVEAITDAQGRAILPLASQTRMLDAVMIRPAHGHWSLLKRNLRVMNSPLSFRVEPLTHGSDALAHFYAQIAANTGRGLKVAVVDTGVGPHSDLSPAGGANTVVGEYPAHYHDNGLGHGTHVAGIIAAQPGKMVQSLAPGAALHAYRVFAQDAGTATNYAIAKAIDQAVSDGCHLINLSLGGPQADEATSDAITQALSAGTVVVAANGNDGRQPVSFPASVAGVVAVSAFGRKGTYPANSAHAWHEDLPAGQNDPLNYMARFTNIGLETRFTGPGVAIISTYPGGYAALDGTSMAAPAVTARLAAMWASDAGLMNMAPDLRRTAAVLNTAMAHGRLLGFGAHFEGDGQL